MRAPGVDSGSTAINALKPLECHVELGARLAPLRDRGIATLASGNVVHNLRAIDRAQPDGGFDWAHRFDDAVRDLMTTSPDRILAATSPPDFGLAVPTPDHFVPLLYAAGLAAQDREASALVRGYSLGSLSMTAYASGCKLPKKSQGAAAAPLLAGVPADQTNT